MPGQFKNMKQSGRVAVVLCSCYFNSIHAIHVLLQNFEYHMLAQGTVTLDQRTLCTALVTGWPRAGFWRAEVLEEAAGAVAACWPIHANWQDVASAIPDTADSHAARRSGSDPTSRRLTMEEVKRVDWG
jgi:hypothetical protein